MATTQQQIRHTPAEEMPVSVSSIYAILQALPLVLAIVFLLSLLAALLLAVGVGLIYILIPMLVVFSLILSGMLILHLHWQSVRYRIEPNRMHLVDNLPKPIPGNIVMEYGVLVKHTDLHSFEAFKHCSIQQSFLEKIWNCGDIVLGGNDEVIMRGVKKPYFYMSYLQEQINNLKGDVVRIQEQYEVRTDTYT
jgi:hypothetical protein